MPAATISPKTLPPGVYCPTITFFEPTAEQNLDVETHVKHMEFLAKSGLAGVVVQGSTAEAVTLDDEERKTLIRTAKEAFKRCGNHGPVIAGTVGAQSSRQALKLCQDAAEAGADFALVLPPSYYPAAMSADAIQSFFEELASTSPIPIIIYSYPGVCSGINMDTDLICRLARHPNIVGVKHTDHDVGRIARETAQSLSNAFGSPFTILGGASDYLLGTVAVGGQGAITGMANVAPRVCVKAFELARAGRYEEALQYARVISTAEWGMGKGAILGTKYMTAWANDYAPTAALARKPLPLCPESTKQHVRAVGTEIVALERSLEQQGWAGAAMRGETQSEKVLAASKKINGIANGAEEMAI
ncbi:dihydrodipicolinate synthetase family protein [Cryptococcus neoformans]|nr:dihydrodipicolinate synthetase family protein [Cryptococcus neoformans var. grubii Th84]OXH15026.1 dihydrodipicolinate synthetase family protein [Cryptococcus neoformans var. grubii]OXH35670.1 dihydrodipicolinate synthetase family protein [Cryptococcus neoformans var. grubii]OXH56141.1 dihydrodipicolinate synthetase family protein [Cryptococcus neoformans var. grubii]OXH56230.1 dihydrodipicolinate synthetase family protein [Cryptococcus neoformans var. grubii]